MTSLIGSNQTVMMAVSAAIATFAALPHSVAADTTGATRQIEEIVVTARKREESLIDAPLTVTAFTSASLEAAGLTDLADVSLFAPGLQFHPQADQVPGRVQTSIRFRGMYINDPNPTQQLGSMFMDGVYISGGVAGIGFEDVERVEVIKGPQSAIFGRSTFGGAVNYITRDPGNEYLGQASVRIGSHTLQEITASHEGPLIKDRLFYRVSGRSYSTDGPFRSEVDGGRMGAERTRAIQATLLATPNDHISLRLRGMAYRDDDGAPAGFFLGSEPAGIDRRNCIAQSGGPQFPGQRDYFCGAIPVTWESATTVLPEAAREFLVDGIPARPILDFIDMGRLGLERRASRLSLSADFALPTSGIVVSTVTAFARETLQTIRDLDFDQIAFAYGGQYADFKDWSQELRIASADDQRLRWLVGANYFKFDYFAGLASRIPLAPGTNFFTAGVLEPQVVTTRAVFGSTSWDLNEQWALSAEARYQWDSVDQGITPGGIALKRTFTNFLPRVTVQYRPAADTNLYALFARGNKPGSFNPEYAGLSPSQQAEVTASSGAQQFVDEEDLFNLELGWKQSLLDGRASVAVAAYQMRWRNQKTRVPGTYTDGEITRLGNFLVSAGRTDLRGLEIEAQLLMESGVDLGLTFNWADSEYKVFRCDFLVTIKGDPDCAGKQTPRFPEFSGTASAGYQRSMGAQDWMAYGRVDLLYFGKAYADEANIAWARGYTHVNGRIGIRRENVTLEVWVRNLFDDDNYLAAARFTDFSALATTPFDFSQQGVMVTPPPGRQIGARLGFRF